MLLWACGFQSQCGSAADLDGALDGVYGKFVVEQVVRFFFRQVALSSKCQDVGRSLLEIEAFVFGAYDLGTDSFMQ